MPPILEMMRLAQAVAIMRESGVVYIWDRSENMSRFTDVGKADMEEVVKMEEAKGMWPCGGTSEGNDIWEMVE